MNQAEIDLQQKEEVFKKFNLCISYIRFIFASPDDLSTFDIRIPLGEFQDNQLITFFDIQQLIEDNSKDRSFLEESWYTDNLGYHSERVLLVWIIQNQQYLADQIYKQIFARNYSQKNLKLLKVYLEIQQSFNNYTITSERKVCNTCILFKIFYQPQLQFKLVEFHKQNNLAVCSRGFQHIMYLMILQPYYRKCLKILFQLLMISLNYRKTALKTIIIVTQFLYESLAKINQQENIEKENNRQNKVDISFQDQRKVIYIDTKYVGLLTHKYLNLRYMGLIKNSEIIIEIIITLYIIQCSQTENQLFQLQIDKVRLINSFFMSKEMDDDQEKSKKGSKDQSSTSSKRSLLNNATVMKCCHSIPLGWKVLNKNLVKFSKEFFSLNRLEKYETTFHYIIVLQEKMEILRNAANNPIKIEKIAKQYIKDTYLEQIRIQQCYSLIWIMIENMDEVLTEANLFFLSISMFYSVNIEYYHIVQN